MTTGPIYLVSACATPDEFVAAFRRYADRGSLFVPIAEPLPPGRRGRLALTLADGGVMLEGDAEIVASSKTASVLHGRIGMTIRFTEPDDSSRLLLTELDKARVAPRLAAVTVVPRAAGVPAQPRPVPPSPAGRIDAANALAECVAIGDLGGLREGAAPVKPMGKLPAIPSGKVPTIPPKFASTQAMEPLPKAPSKPFRLPTPPPVEVVVATRAKPPTEPPPIEEPANIVDRPPPRLPTNVTQAAAVVPPPTGVAPPPRKLPGQQRMTSLGIQAITRTPPMPMPTVTPTLLAELDETTDINELAEVRSTAPGLGVPPAHDTELMVARTVTSPGMAPAPAAPLPVEPDGDWTMTPDAAEPTPLEAPHPSLPAGPMTGNWTIALTPDGWTEPEKVAASLPTPGLPTMVSGETGKPVVTAQERAIDPDEGKIQIDPTLMEPLTPMPQLDSEPVFSPPPMAYAAPPEMFRAPDPTSLVDIGSKKSRKGPVIGIAAVAVVGGGIAAVLAMSGGKSAPAKPADAPAATKIALTAPVDAAVVVDAPVAILVDAAPVAPPDCTVEILSVQKDVEVDVDTSTKIGFAPGKLQLPCGAEVKLYFRKPGFAVATKTITPAANAKPIKIAMLAQARAQYVVRVSSAPAGATITVGGKAAGVTPTLVRVDGNQPAVISIAKNGYEPVEQKVAAKATPQAVHVKLVPKKRSR